jgi:hypothetical protein
VEQKDIAVLPEAPGKKACAAKEKDRAAEDAASEDLVLVRVLEDIPTFAGVDKDYKLKKEDIISLPKGIADTLLSHGKIRIVGSS